MNTSGCTPCCSPDSRIFFQPFHTYRRGAEQARRDPPRSPQTHARRLRGASRLDALAVLAARSARSDDVWGSCTGRCDSQLEEEMTGRTGERTWCLPDDLPAVSANPDPEFIMDGWPIIAAVAWQGYQEHGHGTVMLDADGCGQYLPGSPCPCHQQRSGGVTNPNRP